MRLVDGGLPFKGTHRRLRTIRLRGNWSFMVLVLIGFIGVLLLLQIYLWVARS